MSTPDNPWATSSERLRECGPVHLPAGFCAYVSFSPTVPLATQQPFQVVQSSQPVQPVIGMPTSIQTAIRMLQPYYPDDTTAKIAGSFWESFERATVGLDDVLRLSAFRECLKGTTGEQWWAHSRIENFDALKTRFYNQFICQTPQQRIELLKKTTRSQGMSAKVWSDLISRLCDDTRCYDLDLRYQYFLSGLRNRE
ncbi:hypothetical protein P3T76_001630 [Phytophthora citrophthora]|uniref:Retrotransposon gag domain-containing protein n=1 Tax=Phytophthora citrophthora TaxID=4793 RepID=A0AAD9GYW8_9STRA|nr:hypothetical protein P3T76_001630 [Phytophthora citrophthora]